MVEFIKNVGQWFAEHKDIIVTTLTSTQFIGFVTTIIMFIKQKYKIAENTAQSKSLENVIKENKSLTDKVTNLENTLSEQNKILADFKDYVVKNTKTNNEDVAVMNEKLNSIIDASSVAWSTIRDEEVRKNVGNILTTAKYREAGKLKDVQDKVVNLQKELLETTQKLQEQIQNNAKKVEEVVEFQPAEEDNTINRV